MGCFNCWLENVACFCGATRVNYNWVFLFDQNSRAICLLLLHLVGCQCGNRRFHILFILLNWIGWKNSRFIGGKEEEPQLVSSGFRVHVLVGQSG